MSIFLFVETGSLTGLGTCQESQASWPVNSRSLLPLSTAHGTEIIAMDLYIHPAFYMVSGPHTHETSTLSIEPPPQ